MLKSPYVASVVLLLIQLDKKLGDQIILADFGGFLVIGDCLGRQYYLSNCIWFFV